MSLIYDLEVIHHRMAFSNGMYGSEESPWTLKQDKVETLLHNYSPLNLILFLPKYPTIFS